MNDVLEYLKNLGIDYVLHEHPAVFTVEESDRVSMHMNGAKTKNLFLRNRNGDQHYLYSLPGHKRADIKALANFVSEQKLSFASPERLQKYLGLTPGSVTPFGLINDSGHDVIYILDQELNDSERVCFHPNTNTATVELAAVDFKMFLESSGVHYRIWRG